MNGGAQADTSPETSPAGAGEPSEPPANEYGAMPSAEELMAAMGGGSDADSPAMMRPGDAADDDDGGCFSAADEDDNDSLPDESAFDRR